jgi:hypothetical protein
MSGDGRGRERSHAFRRSDVMTSFGSAIRRGGAVVVVALVLGGFVTACA